MSRWEGKSKGSVLGYKIFIFMMKNFGIRAAYVLLIFVSSYYVLFASSTKYIWRYFRKHQTFSFFKSFIFLFKNYFVFGQTLIDKTAVSGGLIHKFSYEFDGIENIHQLAKQETGGIMISAHIGNFELAQYFFNGFNKKIYVVTTDLEKENLKKYLESVGSQSFSVDFIYVKEDMSHIFEIHKALQDKQLVCFTGDRFMGESKTLTTNFLGKEAHFPAGPFLLSSRLNYPVLFVHVMKESNLHYHLYARKAEFSARNAQQLLDEYAKNLTDMLRKYPAQWFNYYDFWDNSEN